MVVVVVVEEAQTQDGMLIYVCLLAPQTESDAMTIDVCMNFCANAGQRATYAGLEYGRECWCAISLNVNAAKLPDANCSLPCEGEEGVACGGEWK